jgi:UDP-N-acetylglucosamine diphosphorylase/glucosamine-1-phosphate N-acetyltransferase
MPEVSSGLFEETLTPLLRLKNLAALRDGVFAPRDRGVQGVPGAAPLKPATLIENIGSRIEADTALLAKDFSTGGKDLQTEGDPALMFIHPTAQISRYAVLDTTDGPVVIDAEASVNALSLVKGPAYIGKKTRLDACRFANAIAGENCRLGGEIADSIIGDFTNKHHEGFLGHSLVGDWVNLGALTTTSDLKNNYGEVRLAFRENKYPAGTIKFGSIIGDYAKTAIGTMLGTGSIIDLGANLFGLSHRSGYFRPFLWGETKIYDRSKFIEDAARMMQRRGQTVTPELEKLLRAI